MINDQNRSDQTFVAALCILSFAIVLFLLRPGVEAMGSLPTANLYLAVPFVLIAVFCFQLVLEGSELDDSDRQNRA